MFSKGPPSSLLWEHISNNEKQVEMVEFSQHTMTIPVLHTCRICEPDEDEQDDVLVELGCDCRGKMSRMHRKCILEWYGTRMLLQNNYKCEICKALLDTKTQAIVAEAVSDHENGGRAILMAALKSQLAPFVWMKDIESAANYEELVELLTATKAEVLLRMELGTVNGEIHDVAGVRNREALHCTWSLAFILGSVAAAVGLYAYLMHHYFGSSFH